MVAPGKQLPQVLGERLAGISARWEQMMTERANTPYADQKREYYMAAAGSAVQLLSTLCTHFINEDRNTVITAETQRRLSPILSIWARRYRGKFLGDVSLRMIAYMSNKAKFDEDFKTVRKMYKNWDVCGLPLCNIRKYLKVCGK